MAVDHDRVVDRGILHYDLAARHVDPTATKVILRPWVIIIRIGVMAAAEGDATRACQIQRRTLQYVDDVRVKPFSIA